MHNRTIVAIPPEAVLLIGLRPKFGRSSQYAENDRSMTAEFNLNIASSLSDSFFFTYSTVDSTHSSN